MKHSKKTKKSERNIIIICVVIFTSIILGVVIIDRIEELQNIFYYNFEDDKIGSYPDGFVGNLRNTDYTRVVYWDEIHGNVVEIKYLEEPPLNPIIGGGMEFNTLFGLTKKGVVEFDIYIESIVNRIYLDICQTDVEYDYRDDVALRMTTKDGLNILVVNEYGILEEISTFSLKGWYHFKIKFNVETGYDLTIIKTLGTEVFSGHFDFFYKPQYFTQVYFATYTLGTVFYVDNIRIEKLERI